MGWFPPTVNVIILLVPSITIVIDATFKSVAPVEMPRAAKAIFFPKPIAAIMEKRLYDQPEKKYFAKVQYLAPAPKFVTYIPVGGNQPIKHTYLPYGHLFPRLMVLR